MHTGCQALDNHDTRAPVAVGKCAVYHCGVVTYRALTLFLLAVALIIGAIVGLRWWRNRREPQRATDTSNLGTAGTPFPTLAGGATTGAASGRGRSGSHRKD